MSEPRPVRPGPAPADAASDAAPPHPVEQAAVPRSGAVAPTPWQDGPHAEEAESGPASHGGIPLGAVAVLTLAGMVVLMVGLHNVADVFGPAFLAFSLVIAVRPLRLWLTDRRVPGWIAGGAVALLLYAILLAIIGSMAYSVMALVEKAPDYAGKFQVLYGQLRDLLTHWGISETDLGDSVLEYAQPSRIITALTTVLTGLSSVGSQLFVLVMVVAFLMIDSTIIQGRRGQLLAAKQGLGQAFEDFSRRTSKYWIVNTVFGAIVAALDWLVLLWLGVPLAFTWGVFAFVTNYIPNIGFIIGVIPPALLGLLDGGPVTALWVIVWFSVINFVAQAVIQPKITGDAVGLNTTVTFLSLMFWSAVIGPLGAILAVPLTLFFKAVLIDSDARSRWVGIAFDSRGRPIDLRGTARMINDDGRISLRRAYGREPPGRRRPRRAERAASRRAQARSGADQHAPHPRQEQHPADVAPAGAAHPEGGPTQQHSKEQP